MSCRHKFSEKNAPIIYKSAYKLVGSLRSVEISTSMPTGNCVGPCHPPGHPFFLPHIPTTLQPPHTNTPPPPPHTYDTPCSRTPPLALPSSIITCSVMARRKKSAHTHERRSQDTTASESRHHHIARSRMETPLLPRRPVAANPSLAKGARSSSYPPPRTHCFSPGPV